jgi:hypothetical protein
MVKWHVHLLCFVKDFDLIWCPSNCTCIYVYISFVI